MGLFEFLLSQFTSTKPFKTKKSHQVQTIYPSVSKHSPKHKQYKTFLCDLEALLTTNSLFPYFMLVAFEAGSLLRELILLLFISFVGLRKKDVENVSKSVLPKFYLENLNSRCYEVMASAEKRAVASRMPRIMIETFLRDFYHMINLSSDYRGKSLAYKP